MPGVVEPVGLAVAVLLLAVGAAVFVRSRLATLREPTRLLRWVSGAVASVVLLSSGALVLQQYALLEHTRITGTVTEAGVHSVGGHRVRLAGDGDDGASVLRVPAGSAPRPGERVVLLCTGPSLVQAGRGQPEPSCCTGP